MNDTLLFIVKNLVDHPDDVSISEKQEENRTVYMIHSNQEDIGKIIGKQGRIIRAIRDLIKIIAAKHDRYVDVAIAEDINPTNTTNATNATKE